MTAHTGLLSEVLVVQTEWFFDNHISVITLSCDMTNRRAVFPANNNLCI